MMAPSHPYHTLTQSALQIPVSRRLEANRHEESFLAFQRRWFTLLIGQGGLEQDWKHSAISTPNDYHHRPSLALSGGEATASAGCHPYARIRLDHSGVLFLSRDCKSDCPSTNNDELQNTQSRYVFRAKRQAPKSTGWCPETSTLPQS